MLEAALRRPLTHFTTDDHQTQWATDKRLGLLDWAPSDSELRQYVIHRAEMGDEWARNWADKARNGDPI